MNTQTSNLEINYPEMWGNSESEIQAEFTGIGKKPYRVTSRDILIISLIGVEYNGQVKEFGANNVPNKRKGWHKYYMTKKAFQNLTKSHKVVLNCLLD